ncbi:MAG TPA: phosphoglycerate dehydrogenase [Bryobacteraceae bacterium]|nr:phosphoglycerate dehydrogenase [Bryobacteraceae bacterium]
MPKPQESQSPSLPASERPPMRILVAEPVSPAGVELLKSQEGFDVIVSNPKEYSQYLADAEALVVRSAVKVTGDVLAKAPKLKVIGRAGVGVDNVDLPAATAAGVLVMNTPGGNAVSVAEHTFALMLAMARSVPQASASTRSGKWEKKKFLGNELRGKTLGIVGLGSIGREVVKRARTFEMRIVVSDPYVSPQILQEYDIEQVDLRTLYSISDYITLHVALTPETAHMLDIEAFALMRKGVRIINCARGELVDTKALDHAIRQGIVAGAALDVFEQEPPGADNPLFEHECVIASPHIGGSTEEAQEIVGVRIVEQMIEYLRSGVVINAVNMPALSPEQYRALGPYIQLAERLGNFVGYVSTGNPRTVCMTYFGKIADQNTTLIRNAGISGVLNRSLAQRANLVNAMQLASDRGWVTAERHDKRAGHMDTVQIDLETDSGVTSVEGALVLDKPRLIKIDGIYCEAPLAGHILFLKNEDVPGVIGYVGSVLGRHGINIANFSLGRQETPGSPGSPVEAVAVVETDGVVPDEVVVELLHNPAVKMARHVEFTA